MTEVSDRFDALIDALTHVGSPIGRFLRPGLPAGALNDALASLQLAPPSELIDWFGLQDGPDDDGYQQAEPGGSPLEVFPGVRPLSLDEAVALCLDMRRSVEELGEDAEQFWRSDWFPIAYGPGSTFAVPCPANTTNDPAAVWRSLSHPGPSETGRVTASLADLIGRWTAEIRAGNVYWDAAFRSLEPRDGEAVRLEAEGLY
jgi:hypothetical protein